MRMSWKKKEPNLFHKNLDNNYQTLYDSIQLELSHYSSTIFKVINNLDIKKYGVRWKRVENFYYEITIPKIIKIPKPKYELELRFDSQYFENNDFDPKYLLINHAPMAVGNYRIRENENVVFVEPYNAPSQNDELMYKGHKLTWILKGGYNISDIQRLKDQDGNKIDIPTKNIIERSDSIDLHVNSNFRDDRLYLDNNEINFSIDNINFYRGEYLDDNGELVVHFVSRNRDSSKNNKLKISTSRKIKGILHEQANNLQISYQKMEQKGGDIWIELIDPESHSDIMSSLGTSAVEIFLDILYASEHRAISYQVEDNKNKGKKRTNKIKVFSIDHREFMLKLQSLPKSPVIYPAKIDSQLMKQRWALNMLRDRPSPYHKGLLKLFERVGNAKWDGIEEGKELSWNFLVEDDDGLLREGTELQRDFVQIAFETPDYAILEGPPGSGKTTALTELIFQLIEEGKRVLLSASTHVAIDNVVEKLIDHFGTGNKLMQNGIVPLRIGRINSIGNDVAQFHIDERREKLKKKLANDVIFGNRSTRVSEEELDEYLTNIVINSSNLVCGTTIGILQYPNFRKQKNVRYVEPEFDYLIIDEASKTTVQQFLVPAINAKRWIISGDSKQLSPYMETLHIRVCLEGMIGRHKEEALLMYFVLIFEQGQQRNKEGKLPQYLIPADVKTIESFLLSIQYDLESEDTKRERQAKTIRKMKIGVISSQTVSLPTAISKYVDVVSYQESMNGYSDVFRFLNHSILFVDKQDFESLIPLIPVNYLILHPDLSEAMIKYLFKHQYWYQKSDIPYYIRKGRYKETGYERIRDDLFKSLARKWSGELSWRLGRIYELQDVIGDNKSVNYYKACTHALLPQGKDHWQIWSQVQRMAQIFFPSILRCVQYGIKGEYKIRENNTVLSKGIPKSDFDARHILLKYQHRMHDEIAAIPRSLYYSGNGVKALMTSKNLDRQWENGAPFPNLPKNRQMWIHVSDQVTRNRNNAEITLILDHLAQLERWSRRQNSNGGIWSVAVITYYNKQRDALATGIKKRFSSVNQQAKVEFSLNKQLRVVVYTVDKIQGKEADITLISMVRNSKLGFMDSPNRLNVAITRAKYLQVIFGNADFFSNCDSKGLNSLVRDITRRGGMLKYTNGTKGHIKKYNPGERHKPKTAPNRRRNKK